MPGPANQQKVSQDSLRAAERLRQLLSQWVRTTRDHAGTPSSARVETLRLLQDEGPATITSLAARRSVKHQSMRLIVIELILDETVTKQVDRVDRRNLIVSITNKGRYVLKQEQNIRAKWIAELFQDWTSEEMRRVEIAMNTLQELLDSAPKPPDAKPL